MLLDLRSLWEAQVVAAVAVTAGGSLGHVVSDSKYPRFIEEVEADNLAAILVLYASGALSEDEFAALLAA